MTIQDIYQLAIKMGIKADPRGKVGVAKSLTRHRKQFEKLPKDQQKYFDKESLSNPYSDTRILYGDPQTPVKKILVGIDIDTPEILLANELIQKGQKIDLVLAHHPTGLALAGLHEVVEIQIEMYANFGVPINIAEALLNKKIKEIERGVSPINHHQPIDAARLLNIPLMSCHTPADNQVYQYLTENICQKKSDTVGEVLEELMKIPEYQRAAKLKSGPFIQVGSPENRAGRTAALEITGGTEGSDEIYQSLSNAGIGTIISMHASEKHYKQTAKHHINRVIAGHISSDSLGMNLFLDELERKGIKILPCSGLIRVSRKIS